MRVLHVLDHSLPIQSGYAFRSASILEALRRRGLDVLALTSPKHDSTEETDLHGIAYHRSFQREVGDGPQGQLQCIGETRKALRPIIERFRPDIIHAHSPCLNGLAAIGLGVPLVYEVRSSWEDAAVSSGKTTDGSLRYRLSRWLETFTARRADGVVVLCDGLMAEFQQRGIANEKLTIVGNAIDPDSLATPKAHEITTLRHKLGLDGKTVLGFFGSFFAWEGLDTLVLALQILREQGHDVTVVLAGGGEDEDKLKLLAQERGVAQHIHFVGRVPHELIPSYYGLADFMVFPRRAIRIAEMVTPLKPLEAMHCGTPVIASNVGGHRELIRDGATGLLFRPDDPRDLADAIVRAMNDPARCREIRSNAANYLRQERTWDRMAERYVGVYERAIIGGSRA